MKNRHSTMVVRLCLIGLQDGATHATYGIKPNYNGMDTSPNCQNAQAYVAAYDLGYQTAAKNAVAPPK